MPRFAVVREGYTGGLRRRTETIYKRKRYRGGDPLGFSMVTLDCSDSSITTAESADHNRL